MKNHTRQRIAVTCSLILLLVAAGDSGRAERMACVVFQVRTPGPLHAGVSVFIAGNHPELGSWNPGRVALRRIGPRLYGRSFAIAVGMRLEYKFTLGKWYFVEKGSRLDELPNRRWTVNADQVVRNTVARWNHEEEVRGAPSAGRGTIETLAGIHATRLGNRRTVWVYLPPSYAGSPARRYPVLYMHDGQNLFDARSAFAGVEWGVDETIDRMVASGRMREIIVVGVANTRQRIDEYTPVADPKLGGGKAALYADFLIRELKPAIDRKYRTLPGRDHTAVMGSSLGGLASLYLVWNHPEVFSKGGVVSPSIWWSDRHAVRMVESTPLSRPVKLWVDMGTNESRRAIGDLRLLGKALLARGLRIPSTLAYEEVQGGRHDERSWSQRLDRTLLYLFPR